MRSWTARITGLFVLTAAVLLGTFGVVSWLAVRASTLASIDAQLATRAQAVAALCEWEGPGEVESDLDADLAADLGAGPDAGVEVRTVPDGELVFRAGAPVPARWPDRDGPGDAADGWRVHAGFFPFVARSGAAEPPAGHGFRILTTASLEPVQRRLAELAAVLAVAGSASMLLAFGLGRVVSRRIVRPLRALGDAAARVAAGGEAEIQRSGTGDEIDRLAGLLDGAFAFQAEALERQARFTADAAHELRNPIASIRTGAEVAARPGRSPDEVAGFLADIVGTTTRMAATVEALLELARLDAGARGLARDVVDLAELVREQARDGRLAVAAARAPVRGDRRLLGILVGNLIDNARRHAAGSVEVEVRTAADGMVELTVRDDGPGVGAGDPQLLFERFRRGSPSAQGAGLGLAIVAAIARAHGGDVGFVAVPVGAAVRVRLPAEV